MKIQRLLADLGILCLVALIVSGCSDFYTSIKSAVAPTTKSGKSKPIPRKRIPVRPSKSLMPQKLAKQQLPMAVVDEVQREPVVSNPTFDFKNSIGMKFVKIQPGEFLMGCDWAELAPIRKYDEAASRYADGERPKHTVKITKPFHMSIYETTIAEFRQFTKESGYKTDAETETGYGAGAHGWNENEKKYFNREKEYTWKYTGFPQSDRHPVGNVSRYDALAFCHWLSEKEGRNYRLPTEAEWEYACRAGATTLFHNGDDLKRLNKVANTADASYYKKMEHLKHEFASIPTDDGYVFSAPVGMFQPNAWGLFDMHGNASEHCSDIYGFEYYKESPESDPQGPQEHTVVNETTLIRHIYRGGSWRDAPGDNRSANRLHIMDDYRYSYIGFRVVVDSNSVTE